MSSDLQQAITHVLQQDSYGLGAIFAKLAQLKELNKILSEHLDSKLVNHCQVVNLVDNQLIVITHNAIWATQFRFQIPQLLNQLQQRPELKGLKAIQCKISPTHHDPRFVEATIDQPMSRLSTETALRIQEMAKTISHEKLQQVMEKIAKHTV